MNKLMKSALLKHLMQAIMRIIVGYDLMKIKQIRRETKK
ncbi:MAG: hypothetical protein K0S47_2586 [Herbinix sp.]|jgi:hypothetical protein|nr:hypothetical protein [Herbinix sp.]